MNQAKTTWIAAVAGSLLCAGLGAQPPETKPRSPDIKPAPASLREDASMLNFDKDQAGKLPAGWKVGQSPAKADPGDPAKPGSPGKPDDPPIDPGKSGLKSMWTVSPDPTAPSNPNVLEVMGSTQGVNGYNICICERHTLKDLEMTAKVRGNTGKVEQGGGIAWRVRNADNFYACAFNPADGKLRLFKVVDGRAQDLGSADYKGSGPDASTWYTVGARISGDSITCSINGQELLRATDASHKDSGHIALWARGDAGTSFDDVMIKKGGDERKMDPGDKPGIPPKEPTPKNE